MSYCLLGILNLLFRISLDFFICIQPALTRILRDSVNFSVHVWV